MVSVVQNVQSITYTDWFVFYEQMYAIPFLWNAVYIKVMGSVTRCYSVCLPII